MMDTQRVKAAAMKIHSDINERKQKIRDLEWEVRELQHDMVKILVDEGAVEVLLPDWTRIRRIADR